MKYKQIKTLKKYKTACIVGHVGADTDALSSMVVFKNFLQNKFGYKKVHLFAEVGELKNSDLYLMEENKLNNEIENYDVCVVLDTPSVERMGKFACLFESAKLTIQIDHHNTNKNFASINISEVVSSTAEILYRIFKEYKYELNKQDKERIYSAITTDTNNFTVGAISKKTFDVVGDIVEDIDAQWLYELNLNTNSLLNMKLLSLAINNAEVLNNGKVVITYITHEQMKKLKAKRKDCTGITNRIGSIEGNKFGCFIEPADNGEFYVSMRAKKGYDVARIAKANGGGGHVGAAAFVSNLDVQKIKKIVLDEFAKQLK